MKWNGQDLHLSKKRAASLTSEIIDQDMLPSDCSVVSVGLNLALGLVTSCCDWKTAFSRPWGMGPRPLVTPEQPLGS